ncbi:hypothetical protein [Massilia sp. TSP1-1-2]|uniref:hypothetical protein n=1 Tax=Massilia sp. TSP1-1-2 TaxID=2804649 RepID=UPI003CE6F75E
MSRWSRIAPFAARRVLVLFACVLVPLFGFGMLAEDVIEKALFSSMVRFCSSCTHMPARSWTW